jgi:hypothetical protein
MSECPALTKKDPMNLWNKRKGESTCFPGDPATGVGYPGPDGLSQCLNGGAPTCLNGQPCPPNIFGCSASSPASVRENYSSCCRPQPYVGLNQTWKQQGKFDL